MEGLGVEQQSAVSRAMEATARVGDWIVVEQACWVLSGEVSVWLGQWLCGFARGVVFAECPGTEEEISFLARYMEGERRQCSPRWDSVLMSYSIAEALCVGGVQGGEGRRRGMVSLA